MRAPNHRPAALTRAVKADRRSLLLGTALASTLLIGSLFTPTTALAVNCTQPAAPAPIVDAETTAITCINTEDRNGAGNIIQLVTTTNAGSYVELYNSGTLVSTAGVGIIVQATADYSPVTIVNVAPINAALIGINTTTTGEHSDVSVSNGGDLVIQSGAFAIQTQALGDYSTTSIENAGNLTISGADVAAINAQSAGELGTIDIANSGDVTATASTGHAFAIFAEAHGHEASVKIANIGDLIASSEGSAANGIYAHAHGHAGYVDIANSGAIAATAEGGSAHGIHARTRDAYAYIGIANSGAVSAISTADSANGIVATSAGNFAAITIVNSSTLTATSTPNSAHGIYALATGENSYIHIGSSGAIAARSLAADAVGIFAETTHESSPIEIINAASLTAIGVTRATGIEASTYEASSGITVLNQRNVVVSASNGQARGISTYTDGDGNYTQITNNGTIRVTAPNSAYGIWAESEYNNHSGIGIVNNGSIIANGGSQGYGILAVTDNGSSPIFIQNFGLIQSSETGIDVQAGASDAVVVNHGIIRGGGGVGVILSGSKKGELINYGTITADSLYAVKVYPGEKSGILNFGEIRGYIKTFGLNDKFVFSNQPGGVFEARLSSIFGGGGFFNEAGAVLHAAGDTVLAGMLLFQNEGLISLQNGHAGDTLSLNGDVGTTPVYDFQFEASGGSLLAVDTHLGGPGSKSDVVIIDGDVSGKTELTVHNTNRGPGGYDNKGIPVVYVNGNVNADAFFLSKPVDSGFFEYDLFFVETGSGYFELRSFPGAGAHLLPQLVTAAQDVFHSTNETWFDRTADLRVLLNGGVPMSGEGGKLAEGAPISASFTPAVWMRGSGTWLEQDDGATSSAYGRTYRHDLSRDLDIWNLEGGIDFGKKSVLAEGDALVFGLLGGGVLASLDYDQFVRQFEISGAEAGIYATYLRGGLFVDTLVKADFLQFDPKQVVGFPGTLDATTWGFRTDTGYRFGGFKGGAFVEPLATIAVAWSDIDGFTAGPNKVSFDDEANVRGRLGLRVGTSYDVWSGIRMEPFVIGSVWGTLSGANSAIIASYGTNFTFTDEPDDVWGVVSTGVNFFSPSASTSLFAKLDVTFGEETDGIGAKAGARVSW